MLAFIQHRQLSAHFVMASVAVIARVLMIQADELLDCFADQRLRISGKGHRAP